MSDRIAVKRVVEAMGIRPDGRSQSVMRVEFMVGDHGPFTREIPREHFSAGAVRAELEAFAREIEQLTR
jgi:hypothetical protein